MKTRLAISRLLAIVLVLAPTSPGRLAVELDAAQTVLLETEAVTVAIPISSNEFDGYEDPEFHISGDGFGDDWVGTDTWVMTGWIFSDVPIPQGATILTSYVVFHGFGNGGSATPRIKGFAEDNTAAFLANGSNKPSTRPTTVAGINWPNTWSYIWQLFQTPDLSPVIQEITNRAGWRSGNNIGFVVSNPSGTGINWAVADYTYAQYHSVTLYVTFSSGTPPVVHEARGDLGMPYNIGRGCESPYTGCGGPFHGFDSGVCTDLVLDAYNSGVPFNIQNVLAQDHRANPGRYRYGTARNAEDMRRYFAANQALLPHSAPYQAGDIGFFDWPPHNGITNHVLVISEVDGNGRPLTMVDASGTMVGHPSGLAWEHSWNSYYDQNIQGHGRLSTRTGPSALPGSETLQVLRVRLNTQLLGLRVLDANGKTAANDYDENLVASNNDIFIPYIPGGSYLGQGGAQTISITQPLSNTAQYAVELTAASATMYQLEIETVQNGSVTASASYPGTIPAGGVMIVPILLSAPGGVITFSASPPASTPGVSFVPTQVQLIGLNDSTVSTVVTVTETSSQQPLSNVDVSISNLSTQFGEVISATRFAITPASFSLPPGGSQSVQLAIDLAGLGPGVYLGTLMLASTNASTRSLPLTLDIQPFRVSLPGVLFNASP